MPKVITGQWLYPNGSQVSNGILTLQLSQDATASGTGQVAPLVIKINLNSAGSIPVSTSIFANDELSPAGTTYIAVVNEPGGGRVWGPEILPITGASPINLNNITPVNSSPPVTIINQNVNTGLFNRLSAGLGTPLSSGDFSLSGWGTGASISSILGSDSAFQITITAGTTPSVDPTFILTYHDGAWPQPPMADVEMSGGTGIVTDISNSSTATQLTAVYLGLPVSGKTYIIDVVVIGTGVGSGSLPPFSTTVGTLNFTTLISNAANPASIGTMRLSTGDTIAWRNNGNSGDLTLSKTAGDNLLFSNGIIATAAMVGQFFSTNTANVAASGAIRLASSESIAWRNNANSADILLSKSVSDILTYASGLQATFFQSPTANIAGTGQVRLAKTDSISWRNNANSADLPLTINGSDQLTFNSSVLGAQSYKIENVNVSPVVISNNNTEQTLMTFTLSANELVGNQALRLSARGTATNTSGGTVNYTLRLYIDANQIFNGANTTGALTSGGTTGWHINGLFILVSGGAGGTIEAQADTVFSTSGSPLAPLVVEDSINTSTLGFDTTVTHVMKVTIQMGTANANASCTQRQMLIERVG